ncbi:hypothetical protein SLS62_008834 [Diatrype stigma]|uniref:N-acetyltransferase domain-containing protein n=1 Tax=Diatrype stigma TaxID=117547 RepID=A0AAN9YJT9_9PEZI
MDLESVEVKVEAAKEHVGWKSWLINTEEYEPYDNFSGIFEMKVTAILTSGNGTKVIGRCELWLISRDKMAYGSFADQVKNISEHAAYLSNSIFDDYGEFAEDDPGFGDLDMDKSDMIWLENIWVDKDYRNQGVAKKMLQEAQKEIEAEVDTCFMIAYPRPRAEDFDGSGPLETAQGLWEGRWDNTKVKFRSLGFREIVSSSYYIYDPDRRYHGQATVPLGHRSLNWTPQRRGSLSAE